MIIDRIKAAVSRASKSAVDIAAEINVDLAVVERLLYKYREVHFDYAIDEERCAILWQMKQLRLPEP